MYELFIVIIAFAVGFVTGAVGGLIIAYLIYRNNKKLIAELIEKAKKVGEVVGG